MSRLADRFFTEWLALPAWRHDAADDAAVRREGIAIQDAIKEATVIEISNVADYFYVASGREHWGFDDFPNIAPPFYAMWFEFVAPKGSEFSLAWSQTQPINQAGVLILADTISNIRSRVTTEQYGRIFKKHEWIGQEHWLCAASVFTRQKGEDVKNVIIGPTHVFTYGVTKLGRLTGKPGINTFGVTAEEKELESWSADRSQGIFFCALLALSFIHCKGVTFRREDAGRERLSKLEVAQLRRRLKRGEIESYEKHRPTLAFRTLEIEPLKRILREAGAETEGVGLKKALHIVRGHFKTYTEQRPLLGRHVGTFFFDSHIRGDRESGTVQKQYSVNAGPAPEKALEEEKHEQKRRDEVAQNESAAV